MSITQWAAKRAWFRALSIPVVVAAVAGFYLGSVLCREFLLHQGQSLAQARFVGIFLGGIGGGLLCGAVVFGLLWPWLKRT
jgi:hypothetical protein